MKSAVPVLFLVFAALGACHAQDTSPDDQPHITPRNPAEQPEQKPPRSQPEQPPAMSQSPGESSSRDAQIDLNAHPPTPLAGADEEEYPFDPHKAAKDVEVGQFYLKRKNYRAALDRFTEALKYKPNDAEATFYVAQTQEKLDLVVDADKTYRKYLEILPNGPHAEESNEAVQRLGPRVAQAGNTPSGAAEAMAAGDRYLGQNDYDSARIQYEQVLRLDPRNAPAYFKLARCQQGLQRLDDARANYRKYLELQPKGPMAGQAKRAISEINFMTGTK